MAIKDLLNKKAATQSVDAADTATDPVDLTVDLDVQQADPVAPVVSGPTGSGNIATKGGAHVEYVNVFSVKPITVKDSNITYPPGQYMSFNDPDDIADLVTSGHLVDTPPPFDVALDFEAAAGQTKGGLHDPAEVVFGGAGNGGLPSANAVGVLMGDQTVSTHTTAANVTVSVAGGSSPEATTAPTVNTLGMTFVYKNKQYAVSVDYMKALTPVRNAEGLKQAIDALNLTGLTVTVNANAEVVLTATTPTDLKNVRAGKGLTWSGAIDTKTGSYIGTFLGEGFAFDTHFKLTLITVDDSKIVGNWNIPAGTSAMTLNSNLGSLMNFTETNGVSPARLQDIPGQHNLRIYNADNDPTDVAAIKSAKITWDIPAPTNP